MLHNYLQLYLSRCIHTYKGHDDAFPEVPGIHHVVLHGGENGGPCEGKQDGRSENNFR